MVASKYIFNNKERLQVAIQNDLIIMKQCQARIEHNKALLKEISKELKENETIANNSEA